MLILFIFIVIFVKFFLRVEFEDNEIYTQIFDKFKLDYNRSYSSSDEHNKRKLIFIKNLKFIDHHNGKRNSFNMSINQFSDMTFKELYAINSFDGDDSSRVPPLKFKSPKLRKFYENDFKLDAPDEFNWRDINGVISSIKDQGLCGSCYVFAVLDCIESQLFMAKNLSVEFSRQEIVDCANGHNAFACNGGSVESSISYINERKSLSLESDYPYRGIEEKCRENVVKFNITVPTVGIFNMKDEELLKKALFNKGPIVLSINHLHESFFRYSNGIYYEPECVGEDFMMSHVVLLVGYASENGRDYWIVKNSYGKTWGESGYIRIARNENHCNIASFNLIPMFDDDE